MKIMKTKEQKLLISMKTFPKKIIKIFLLQYFFFKFNLKKKENKISSSNIKEWTKDHVQRSNNIFPQVKYI